MTRKRDKLWFNLLMVLLTGGLWIFYLVYRALQRT
jgi:hypothetical protein